MQEARDFVIEKSAEELFFLHVHYMTLLQASRCRHVLLFFERGREPEIGRDKDQPAMTGNI